MKKLFVMTLVTMAFASSAFAERNLICQGDLIDDNGGLVQQNASFKMKIGEKSAAVSVVGLLDQSSKTEISGNNLLISGHDENFHGGFDITIPVNQLNKKTIRHVIAVMSPGGGNLSIHEAVCVNAEGLDQ